MSDRPITDTAVRPPAPAASSNRRPRRLATQQQAAQIYGVCDKTVRNWISRGLVTGFMLPGGRSVRVDLNEIDDRLRTVPTSVMRTPRTSFGPKAKIVEVAVPVVVAPAEQPVTVADSGAGQ